MPKSVSFACPSVVSRMLEGLTSRCAMPARWAEARPSATCHMIRPPRRAERPVVADQSASDSPSTYSITSHWWSSSVTRSKTDTTCGWLSIAASRASRSARAQVGAGRARQHADPLDRDVRGRAPRRGEPDGAHAAAADLAVERVPACDHRAPSGPRTSGVHAPERESMPGVGTDEAGWALARLRTRRSPPEGTACPSTPTLLDDLQWRGLIAHSTDPTRCATRWVPGACASTSASTRPRRACTWATSCSSSRRAASRTPATRRTSWSAAPPA